LGEGLWTTDEGVVAEQDIRMAALLDACNGSLTGKKVVDLGCLEGGFTVAIARHGAERVVGIEAREISIRRCEVARKLLSLGNVEFVHGDIKNELVKHSGEFDVVFAAGILYHVADPWALLRLMHGACRDVALIDTHVANTGAAAHGCSQEVVHRSWAGKTYRGRTFPEYPASVDDVAREGMLWAAHSDQASFWPFEEDLLGMIKDVGFSTITKVAPGERPDLQWWQVNQTDRVMFVCRK